jgi:hypothetical protein
LLQRAQLDKLTPETIERIFSDVDRRDFVGKVAGRGKPDDEFPNEFFSTLFI